VSSGNLFLEKALKTDPQVVLETKTPPEYSGGMGAFDVVVLDGTSPARIGPGRFVLVNSTPGDVPIESLGTMDQPVVLDWVRTHPVMRFIDLSKVTVEEALRVRPLAAGKSSSSWRSRSGRRSSSASTSSRPTCRSASRSR
jgi:hypothetical protein